MKKEEIIDVLKNYKCNYIRDDQQISLTLKEAFDLIGLPDDQIDDELELLATELSGQEDKTIEDIFNKYFVWNGIEFIPRSVLTLKNAVFSAMQDYVSQSQQEDKISDERFKMPTDKQLIEIMILFNKGKLQKNKLADMLSPCLLILDRLYENGDVTIPTKKEDKD